MQHKKEIALQNKKRMQQVAVAFAIVTALGVIILSVIGVSVFNQPSKLANVQLKLSHNQLFMSQYGTLMSIGGLVGYILTKNYIKNHIQ